jgi:aminoglycoside 6'-N-acetyltransferase
LALIDGVPIGLLQRSFLHDYPEELAELAAITDVPSRAMTIDYLIGEPGNVGCGIGTDLIRSALKQLWADHRDAECVIVVVHADNIASWRALEKAGLTRVASGDLEPDNPIDDRRHHVYRMDRPLTAILRRLSRPVIVLPPVPTDAVEMLGWPDSQTLDVGDAGAR